MGMISRSSSCKFRYTGRKVGVHGGLKSPATHFYAELRRVFLSHCKRNLHCTVNDAANRNVQSSDDVVYEQDILRDPDSIKPWLIYVDYKHQYGTLLEQAFVRRSAFVNPNALS